MSLRIPLPSDADSTAGSRLPINAMAAPDTRKETASTAAVAMALTSCAIQPPALNAVTSTTASLAESLLLASMSCLRGTSDGR